MDGTQDEGIGGHRAQDALSGTLPCQPSPCLQAALLTGCSRGAGHQQEGEQEFLQVLHHSVLCFSGSLRGEAAARVSSCSQQDFIA